VGRVRVARRPVFVAVQTLRKKALENRKGIKEKKKRKGNEAAKGRWDHVDLYVGRAESIWETPWGRRPTNVQVKEGGAVRDPQCE